MNTRVFDHLPKRFIAWLGRIELRQCGREGIAMKGALYDKRNVVKAEEEVTMQSRNEGLEKEHMDTQNASAALLINTGQVLYGYSVDGIRKP